MGNASKKGLGIFLCVAILGLLLVGGLHYINRRIPEGILVSEIDTEVMQRDYKGLCEEIVPYADGAQYELSRAVLVLAKPGTEQLLTYTLREKNPESYVRNLSVERRMRLVGLEVLGCIILCECLVELYAALISRKRRSNALGLRILAFFLICALIGSRGVLPSECIPEKWISLGTWWDKCLAYATGLKNMGRIPCEEYQQLTGLQGILFGLLVISGIGMFWIRRRNCTMRKEKNQVAE
ncbi:MAG: hypothetical protein IJY09_03965 [Lachnospiraceae bacterium]|nr:hypothetical protein [Lachnospiraceae bacterium]